MQLRASANLSNASTETAFAQVAKVFLLDYHLITASFITIQCSAVVSQPKPAQPGPCTSQILCP